MIENRLGIIAGGGDLPRQVAKACRREGRSVFVVVLEGHGEPADFEDFSPRVMALGRAGKILQVLKENQVTDVVLIGGVRRPSLADLGRVDRKTLSIFTRAMRRKVAGDDALLSIVVSEIEAEGIRVIGVDDVLSEILAPKGSIGKKMPSKDAWQDIRRATSVARAVGELDVGQGTVVQGGIVLAVEAVEGTDAMLRRCGSLKRRGEGGVFAKMCKPGQEDRVDLPTIGVQTVLRAAEAGLAGIAVQAGRVLVVDAGAVGRAADEHSVFVIGVDPEDL